MATILNVLIIIVNVIGVIIAIPGVILLIMAALHIITTFVDDTGVLALFLIPFGYGIMLFIIDFFENFEKYWASSSLLMSGTMLYLVGGVLASVPKIQ